MPAAHDPEGWSCRVRGQQVLAQVDGCLDMCRCDPVAVEPLQTNEIEDDSRCTCGVGFYGSCDRSVGA